MGMGGPGRAESDEPSQVQEAAGQRDSSPPPPSMSRSRSRQRSREGQRPSPPDKPPTLSTPPLTCTAQDEQSQVPAAAGQLDLANGRQQDGEEALGVEAEGGQLAGHRVRGGPGGGRGYCRGGDGGPSSLNNEISAGLNRGGRGACVWGGRVCMCVCVRGGRDKVATL